MFRKFHLLTHPGFDSAQGCGSFRRSGHDLRKHIIALVDTIENYVLLNAFSFLSLSRVTSNISLDFGINNK